MEKPSMWGGDDDSDEPSFLREMLTSKANINMAALAAATGAVLSLPLGLAGFLMPMAVFAAGEALASLYVPDMPSFRERVRAKRRRERRERMRSHLLNQIRQRATESDPRWAVYFRIVERGHALAQMAHDRTTSIGVQDVEPMEDAALDYLALWLTRLTIGDRLDSMSEADIDKRLHKVDEQIEAAGGADRGLRKAKSDLLELATRRKTLVSRKAAAEAALLALPDAVEEIFGGAVSSPSAGQVGAQLSDAIQRLRVEEEIIDSIDAELGDIPLATRAQAARAVKH